MSDTKSAAENHVATIGEREALDLIAFRVREALGAAKQTTAGRSVYGISDLLAALNDVLEVTKAAGIA